MVHGRLAVEMLVITRRLRAARSAAERAWKLLHVRSFGPPGAPSGLQSGLTEAVTITGLERISDGPLVEAARLALRAMDQADSVDAQRILFAFHWELCEVVVERDSAWMLRVAEELTEAAAGREPPCAS